MMLTEINNQLFLLINAAPNTPRSIITIAIFFAQYLIYLPIIIGIFFWFKKPASREVIYKIIATIIFTLTIAAILRGLINSPRPFELGMGTNNLLHSSSNSFPSKHASFIFAITFALYYSMKQKLVTAVFFIASLSISILVCWARIYLGVHWPFDILAAVLTSFICASIVNKYWLDPKKILKVIRQKKYAIAPNTTNKITKN